MKNVKKKKKRERQKEKNQFFLSNGGLGDWWSMSFGLFHLHWKYFIRLTHTRFFLAWGHKEKPIFTQTTIGHKNIYKEK